MLPVLTFNQRGDRGDIPPRDAPPRDVRDGHLRDDPPRDLQYGPPRDARGQPRNFRR
jgi:hypothetical protein